MHADLLATLNCRWLFSALLCAVLLLGSRTACGEVLQLYAFDDTRSSAVVLRHISVSKLRGIMRRAGLDEPRYPLREHGGRTFYVTGPSSYVDRCCVSPNGWTAPLARCQSAPRYSAW